MNIGLSKQLNRSECWKKHKETIREKAAVGTLDHNPVRLKPHIIPRVIKTTYRDISVFSNLLPNGSPFV
jgi:hypothetical protein